MCILQIVNHNHTTVTSLCANLDVTTQSKLRKQELRVHNDFAVGQAEGISGPQCNTALQELLYDQQDAWPLHASEYTMPMARQPALQCQNALPGIQREQAGNAADLDMLCAPTRHRQREQQCLSDDVCIDAFGDSCMAAPDGSSPFGAHMTGYLTEYEDEEKFC